MSVNRLAKFVTANNEKVQNEVYLYTIEICSILYKMQICNQLYITLVHTIQHFTHILYEVVK